MDPANPDTPLATWHGGTRSCEEPHKLFMAENVIDCGVFHIDATDADGQPIPFAPTKTCIEDALAAQSPFVVQIAAPSDIDGISYLNYFTLPDSLGRGRRPLLTTTQLGSRVASMNRCGSLTVAEVCVTNAPPCITCVDPSGSMALCKDDGLPAD